MKTTTTLAVAAGILISSVSLASAEKLVIGLASETTSMVLSDKTSLRRGGLFRSLSV